MSRGNDGPEIDDFRDSGYGWGRDPDRDLPSDWNWRLALHNIHREEDRADRRDTEGRERGNKDRPPIPREERVQQILSQRVRTKYTDRNRQYALRDSEINTLGEVGKFRVVGMNDLAEFAYNGDRWREDTPAGRVNRKVILGSVEQYPTKSAALRAAEPLRTNASAGNPAVPVTVGQLVKHYTNNELPSKAHSTQRTVETLLNVWMVPQWGDFRLSDVRAVEVENWLRGLSLANATKAKIRNVMYSIFAHAWRHEWLMRNPISLVRQSAKRTKVPDVLDAEELRKLLTEPQNPARAVVFLTAATGLRISEALGLKWSDVDFSAGMINLSRAVVHQHVGEMKTEASQKPVPMDGTLAALRYWSTQTWYRKPDDWVFASSKMHGMQPYWPETLLRCYVQPAARRVGIQQIGWHSFRRTFATLLKGTGEDVKTVQELMRHANSRLTLEVYAKALTPAKRAAHLKVVEMIRPAVETEVVPICSHA